MIERYNYLGDINIGFSATVTSSYVLVAPEFDRAEFFGAEESVESYIAGTRYPGLFTAGNSDCLLVPGNLKQREREKLENSSIQVHVLDSHETALGNLVLAGETGALVSPRLSDSLEEIEEALGVDAETGQVAGIPNPGVTGAVNSNGVLLHREATEEEAARAREVLGVEKVNIGTVNLGSPYIGSGLLCNDSHVLVGEDTSGPEIGRIDRTLQDHG